MVSQGQSYCKGMPPQESGAKTSSSLLPETDNCDDKIGEGIHDDPPHNEDDINDMPAQNDSNEESCHNDNCQAENDDDSSSTIQDHVLAIDIPQQLQVSLKTQSLTNQMLLSGVQTIPEQLPLILTEGDAEEHESLTIIAGSEQLQTVSTQAVLEANLTLSSTSTGMMVLASGTSLSPSGQLIQLGPANVLVLQSLDANDQEFQSSPIIVQADEQSKISVTDGKTDLSEGKSTNKEYKCPEPGCSKVAPTASKLKLHMLSHTGDRPHKCTYVGCDWAFTTAYKLKRHLRGHTGEKPFICEINNCGKTFTTTYNLRTHQKAHIREQSNICSFPGCGLSFTTTHRLEAHEKKHVVSQEIHTCVVDGCGKVFKSLSYYNAHLKTHSGERPHACTFEGCGKSFTKASKLKLHIRTHTGERPFVCEEEGCNWSFTSAYKLKRHMMKHSGERPFTCPYSGCGKSFTRASHMRTHELSHTGEKPFSCTFEGCGKSFTTASTLAVHMRKHASDKPFGCSVEGCDRSYTTAANLRLHQKRHEEKTATKDNDMTRVQTSDHASSIHFVEIGGVNSVVATSPSSVASTPYSVMHSFSGEDFGSEDVPSLTVVHYSSEETFPPSTSVSDSSHGICFPFASRDTFATSSHGNVSLTTGTPLASPGAHYVQASIDVSVSDELGASSRSSEQLTAEQYDDGNFIVRKTNSGSEGYSVEQRHAQPSNSNNQHYMAEEDHDSPSYIVPGQNSLNEGYIVRESSPNSAEYVVEVEESRTATFVKQASSTHEYVTREQSSHGKKSSEEFALPTMVVFTSSENGTSTVDTEEEDRTVDIARDVSDTTDNNVGALSLRQRSESTSIAQFAPPSVIFQTEDIERRDNVAKESHDCQANIDVGMKEPQNSSLSIERSNATLHDPPNLGITLALSDEMDKSPVSPFIPHHSLDHESTINIQDLR